MNELYIFAGLITAAVIGIGAVFWLMRRDDAPEEQEPVHLPPLQSALSPSSNVYLKDPQKPPLKMDSSPAQTGVFAKPAVPFPAGTSRSAPPKPPIPAVPMPPPKPPAPSIFAPPTQPDKPEKPKETLKAVSQNSAPPAAALTHIPAMTTPPPKILEAPSPIPQEKKTLLKIVSNDAPHVQEPPIIKEGKKEEKPSLSKFFSERFLPHKKVPPPLVHEETRIHKPTPPPGHAKHDHHYDLKLILKETKIKDIMTQDIVTIQVDAPFSQVPRKFDEFAIRHLPIVDSSNILVGLITQRGLYKIHSPRRLMDGTWYYDDEMLNSIILKHVMIQNPDVLNPDHSLGKAVMKMVYGRFGALPVVDEQGALVGIVTRSDILKRAARIYSEVYKTDAHE